MEKNMDTFHVTPIEPTIVPEGTFAMDSSNTEQEVDLNAEVTIVDAQVVPSQYSEEEKIKKHMSELYEYGSDTECRTTNQDETEVLGSRTSTQVATKVSPAQGECERTNEAAQASDDNNSKSFKQIFSRGGASKKNSVHGSPRSTVKPLEQTAMKELGLEETQEEQEPEPEKETSGFAVPVEVFQEEPEIENEPLGEKVEVEGLEEKPNTEKEISLRGDKHEMHHNVHMPLSTVRAASKFAAGRERAILRKIERDKNDAQHRKARLESSFFAASAIGKLSVAREKSIMERITRERLGSENDEYEHEREDIMERTEKELEQLRLEHEQNISEIKDLGIDVLTPDERKLIGKDD